MVNYYKKPKAKKKVMRIASVMQTDHGKTFWDRRSMLKSYVQTKNTYYIQLQISPKTVCRLLDQYIVVHHLPRGMVRTSGISFEYFFLLCIILNQSSICVLFDDIER